MLRESVASTIEDGLDTLDTLARDARTVLLAIAALDLGGAALLWLAGGVPDVSAATLLTNPAADPEASTASARHATTTS